MILVLATSRNPENGVCHENSVKISCFRGIVFFIGFKSSGDRIRSRRLQKPLQVCFCEDPIESSELVDRSIPIGSEPTNRIAAKQTADSNAAPSKTYGQLSSV